MPISSAPLTLNISSMPVMSTPIMATPALPLNHSALRAETVPLGSATMIPAFFRPM